ncbi:MAG: hypothetical protein WCL14_01830 [Bacteroidota bacterium]
MKTMKINLKVLLILILLVNFNQKSFSEAEKKDATVTINVVSNDSAFVVNAVFTDAKTKAPIKDVEVTLFIKRMYGDIKIGNGKTDETGTLSAVFSGKMPGSDTLGNIFVIAKVEDDDAVNDINFKTAVKAKTIFPAHTPIQPSMISSSAPGWLKMTFWSIVLGVWGLFAYVTYLIFLISRDKSKAH